MKNLSYFILGVLIAWILHASWDAWQGQSWFIEEWYSIEANLRYIAIRLLLEVLLPAAGFLLVTHRFSLPSFPATALILGIAAYLLAYPVAWLLVEISGFLLDPGSEASTQDYVAFTRILNWLTESAGFIAGVCCGLLLVARSRWFARDRHLA
jgi:hypothetical protein